LTAESIVSGTIDTDRLNVNEIITVGDIVIANDISDFITSSEAESIAEGEVSGLASTIFDSDSPKTIISNGFIASDLVVADSIDVNNLSAVSGNMGSLNVDDTLTVGSGGSVQGTNWSIDEDNWVHPSLGGLFFSYDRVADPGTNNDAPSFSSWVSEQTGEGNTEVLILRKVYRHRFGNKHLNLSAFLRANNDAPNATSLDNQFRAQLGGVNNETIDVTTTSYSGYSISLDVSGATVGQDYTLTVLLIARINTGQFGDIARTQLRGDFSIDVTVE